MTVVDGEIVTEVATAGALPDLVTKLIRLGWQLDLNGVTEDRWIHVLRTLYQVDALSGYRLVAVAGGQGAGKTTLVSNLYPNAWRWLDPNPGRGEKVPVCVVEKHGRTEPCGVIVKRVAFDAEADDDTYATHSTEYDRKSIREWERILRGEDTDVLMARLEVPPTFWEVEDAGFLLLPGFERLSTGYWQDLMRIALVTSPSAVVVTDAERLADGMQQLIVQDLRRAGTTDAGRPINVGIVLSRCDGKSGDVVRDLVARAAEVYGVGAGQVVAAGPEPEDPAGWVEGFRAMVDAMLPNAGQARRNEAQLLRKVVAREVLDVIGLARARFDKAEMRGTDEARRLDDFLQPFDESRNQLLAFLDTRLAATFDTRLNTAAVEIGRLLGKDAIKERGRRTKDWFTLDPTGKDRRLMGQVRDTWDVAGAGRDQSACLTATVDQQVDEIFAKSRGIAEGPNRAGEALEAVQRVRTALAPRPDSARMTDDTREDLIMGMKLLPAMAVATRSFVVDQALVTGTLTRPEPGRSLGATLADLGAERKALLAGTALFLGVDVAVDGDLDTPGALAGAVQTLLTGNAVRSAAAVQPYLVAAVAVAVTTGALVQAANKDTRERITLGQRLLQEYRDSTVAQARRSVSDLLDATRRVLAGRLSTDLGLDDFQRKRLDLLLAIREAEQARDRMLRVSAVHDVV